MWSLPGNVCMPAPVSSSPSFPEPPRRRGLGTNVMPVSPVTRNQMSSISRFPPKFAVSWDGWPPVSCRAGVIARLFRPAQFACLDCLGARPRPPIALGSAAACRPTFQRGFNACPRLPHWLKVRRGIYIACFLPECFFCPSCF